MSRKLNKKSCRLQCLIPWIVLRTSVNEFVRLALDPNGLLSLNRRQVVINLRQNVFMNVAKENSGQIKHSFHLFMAHRRERNSNLWKGGGGQKILILICR